MNKNQLYQEWKASRSRVTVPPGFTRRVMAAVDAQRPQRSAAVWDQWLASATSRWAASLALLLLGVFRLAYIAGQLLVPGRIAP